MRTLRAIVVATVLGGVMLTASAADANSDPRVVVSVAPNPVEAGEPFTVTVEDFVDVSELDGCTPGGTVTVTAAILPPSTGGTLGTLSQVANGADSTTYRGTFTAPTEPKPSGYRVGASWVMEGCNSSFSDEVVLTVIPTTEEELSALVTVEPTSVAPGADFAVILRIEGTIPDCSLGLAEAAILPEPVTPLGVLSGVPPGFRGTYPAPSEPGEYEIGARYRNECGVDVASSATLVVVSEVPPTTEEVPSTTEETATTTPATEPPTEDTAAATTAVSALPSTGATTDGLVLMAVLALLLGGGMVTLAARRS